MVDDLIKTILTSQYLEYYILEFYNDDTVFKVVTDDLNGVQFRITQDGNILMPIRYQNKDIGIHNHEYLDSLLSLKALNLFKQNHILFSYDDNLNVDMINRMKEVYNRNIKIYTNIRLIMFGENMKWEVIYDRRCNTCSLD